MIDLQLLDLQKHLLTRRSTRLREVIVVHRGRKLGCIHASLKVPNQLGEVELLFAFIYRDMDQLRNLEGLLFFGGQATTFFGLDASLVSRGH